MSANTAGTLLLAIRVHNRLCQVVAPATPDSIHVSRFRHNAALISIALMALALFALGFLTFLFDFGSELGKLLQIVAAASLGSAFFTLTEASQYMKTATFSPRYSQDYFIRYLLGLVAGFIVGFYGPEVIAAIFDGTTDPNSNTGSTSMLLKLGPPTLALIGGFAADAVYDLLKRLGETLSALVRGSEKDRAEMQAEKTKNQELAQIAKALQAALGETDPAERQKAIEKVIQDALK